MQTDRQTQRDRHTDTQRNGQLDRQADRQTGRQTHSQAIPGTEVSILLTRGSIFFDNFIYLFIIHLLIFHLFIFHLFIFHLFIFHLFIYLFVFVVIQFFSFRSRPNDSIFQVSTSSFHGACMLADISGDTVVYFLFFPFLIFYFSKFYLLIIKNIFNTN